MLFSTAACEHSKLDIRNHVSSGIDPNVCTFVFVCLPPELCVSYRRHLDVCRFETDLIRINRLHTNKADLNERVARALSDAALWEEVKDRLNTSAFGLSGGQQQRLCIARTLAVQPEVILMDEPASALDPMATQKIEELIVELKKQYTIVIVTHNMQQAARVSDKTAFFMLGKLVEYNPTEKMFTNPNEKLTEDYITGRFG